MLLLLDIRRFACTPFYIPIREPSHYPDIKQKSYVIHNKSTELEVKFRDTCMNDQWNDVPGSDTSREAGAWLSIKDIQVYPGVVGGGVGVACMSLP